MADVSENESDLLVDYYKKDDVGDMAKIKIILLGDSAVGKSK